jgi:G:T/U-mismatch repair DNA glycosylase
MRPLRRCLTASGSVPLRAHRIGLWDIFVACSRRGSLDGAIRMAERGEIVRVRRAAPRVTLVCFNGQTAARALPVWRDAGYATLALPSTSPAYTRSFGEKLANGGRSVRFSKVRTRRYERDAQTNRGELRRVVGGDPHERQRRRSNDGSGARELRLARS